MPESRSFQQYEAIFDRHDGEQRAALVEFLVAFAEFDRLKLPIEHGYPSSFAYLTEKRRYSKSSAGRRITAARLIARHPVVVEYLRAGRVGLVTLSILAEVLFAPDTRVAEVLDRAAGCNEDEVMRLKASLRPQPPPPDLIRKLPARAPLPALGAPADALAGGVTPMASELPPSRDSIVPVDAQLFVFRMTVAQAFVDDLGRLRDVVSHKLRDGRTEDVLHDAVRVAIDHYMRKRLGTGRGHGHRISTPSRYIPVHVRRAVWERDQGRCTYVWDGKRCGATWQLQDDHVWAFARGGPATIDNIRLRCGAHNRLAAEQDFGRAHVAARIRERRG